MARIQPLTPFAAALVAAISLITAALLAILATNKNVINGYEDCVAAGNPVLTTYPPQCVTGDGRSFTQPIQ